jgi:hypothetical protein
MRSSILLGLGISFGAGAFLTYGTSAPEADNEQRTAAPSAPAQITNVPYNSDFTFVRLRYAERLRSFGGFRGRGQPGWAHDYPRAERNFNRILREVTLVTPHPEGTNILTTDDPALYDFPIAYLSEPGDWSMTPEEIEGLRNYLLKGGFLIVDDFRGRDWINFEARMNEVLPAHRLVPLDASAKIFDSFFRIDSLEGFRNPNFRDRPEFWGIFENGDPDARLMVVANYNNDIGDYWEWSDAGFLPIDLSNEAYKLGVNYVVYALTH